jgi:hypothetical protein
MLHFFGIAPRITTANVKKQMTPAKKKCHHQKFGTAPHRVERLADVISGRMKSKKKQQQQHAILDFEMKLEATLLIELHAAAERAEQPQRISWLAPPPLFD